MSKQNLTLRWGILATGGIAQSFAKDLTVDPKTRNVTNLTHTVEAAASSSSKSRAEQFLSDVDAPSSARAYGSYEELVKDPNIDIIYVATPHSHHYQNTMLCLNAGKNVLCEKAFTTNAAQAKLLVQKAQEKGLFLMEAVWTRYFPISAYVCEIITSNKLGAITRVSAANDKAGDPYNKYADGKHRMVNMDLAGGALLDLGIYSLTWLFQTLYLTQPEGKRARPSVVGSSMKKFPTGADTDTAILMNFPNGGGSSGDTLGIATTSMIVDGDVDGKGTSGPAVRIQGEKGEVQVWPPIFRPTKTRLILADGTCEDKQWPQPGPGKGSGWYNGFGGDMQPEGEGQGMFWEADECGFALMEGRKEGRLEGWEESVLIMEVMDKVREQNGMKYPEEIESLEYPLKMK